MNNKRIIITGQNGFVGQNYLKILKELSPDSEVYGISRKFSEAENFISIKCDLVDKQQVKSVISEISPDYIFHFAGIAHEKDWNNLFKSNVISTLSLLESVFELNSINPKIIIIGSAAEYGNISPELLPVAEKVMPNPITPYGASMCCRTNIALAFKNMGCDIIIGRVFNITGPGVSEKSPVGSFAKQIAEIEKRKKYPVIYTGNLNSGRDFIDITDVARAFYHLALKSKKGGIYNICSGESHTIAQILDTFLKLSSAHIKVVTDPALIREKDIPLMFGNNQKIRDEIGWKPEIGLKESMKETINFYRNRV
jgi:GDP-4-dehydro-6-deoxy-D-mannose reductase